MQSFVGEFVPAMERLERLAFGIAEDFKRSFGSIDFDRIENRRSNFIGWVGTDSNDLDASLLEVFVARSKLV